MFRLSTSFLLGIDNAHPLVPDRAFHSFIASKLSNLLYDFCSTQARGLTDV